VSAHCHVADLGPVRVSLVTGYTRLAGCLSDFYPLAPCDSSDDVAAEWTIEARLAVPELGMALTSRRVGCRADRETRQALVCSASPRDLAVTVAEAIGEVLVGYCEAHGFTMLNASAVTDGQRVVIVVDGKDSGQSTLARSAVLAGGYRLLADGHLILYRTVDGLVMTSLPVRVGSSLSQASHTLLDNRDVTIVLARDTAPGEPAGAPSPAPGQTAELWPHVRFDWVFSPALNTRHLPRAGRARATFTRDTASRLSELGALCQVMKWRHDGHMAPLLSYLTSWEDIQ
jgi:hypothetical protein